MPPSTIRRQGKAPKAPELQRAFQIATYAHGSAQSLLAGYNSLGKERGPGAPSHEQQDLLRAMLLFAGAGLDACAQQAVQEFIGHSKIQTTFDTYGHLLPGSHDEVRERMDAYLLDATPESVGAPVETPGDAA